MKIVSSQWAMRGLTLSGAKTAGILCDGNWAVQLVDLDVSDTPIG